MQNIKTLLLGLFFVVPQLVGAQSSYLQQGSKEYTLLERLEIKLQRDTVLNFSHIRPFSRKWLVQGIVLAKDSGRIPSLTAVDRYNMQRGLLNNREWAPASAGVINSKRTLFKHFYTDPANALLINQKDFFLAANPVLQLQAIRDNRSEQVVFLNTRGVVFRSLVANKLGFQGYVTENQERPPVFVRNIVNQYRAVPGAGLYKKNLPETAYDYFDARGSFFFNAAKYLDIQFGYDKIFLGNGYRSLFISDFSNSHLFLNLNLKVSRLNYVSRIMELQPQYTRRSLGQDTLFWKKYAAIHYLSFNAPKWLTFGFFEGVVFGRPNRFEFHYLNPIMFLRVAELQVGSADNAFIGFDVKANILKRVQVYGQAMIDEFYTRLIRNKEGWWGDKWAFQGGLKYVDVAGVKNLDLQLEFNSARPFIYSHFDTLANYTHFNQPLAHPFGSGFSEFIGILRYQPLPRWHAQVKWIGWLKGLDPVGKNYGNIIFKDSDTRSADDKLFIGTPGSSRNYHFSLWVAHELRENLFLEGNLNVRKFGTEERNILASFGLRWNMHRREYDY